MEDSTPKPPTYVKEKAAKVLTHNEKEVKGFFGKYRFLSNFWPAKVFLDGDQFLYVENAYQAAKYKKEHREYFKKCSPEEAVAFVTANPIGQYSLKEWSSIKLDVMRKLLIQKFDKNLNPRNHQGLEDIGDKYLEETNYWGDKFWGVDKVDSSQEGVGENNLGKLLMEIRDMIKTAE